MCDVILWSDHILSLFTLYTLVIYYYIISCIFLPVCSYPCLRQTDRKKGRETDRQTQKQRDREIETGRQTQKQREWERREKNRVLTCFLCRCRVHQLWSILDKRLLRWTWIRQTSNGSCQSVILRGLAIIPRKHYYGTAAVVILLLLLFSKKYGGVVLFRNVLKSLSSRIYQFTCLILSIILSQSLEC